MSGEVVVSSWVWIAPDANLIIVMRECVQSRTREPTRKSDYDASF